VQVLGEKIMLNFIKGKIYGREETRSCGCDNQVRTITADYYAGDADCYIGVASEKVLTVYLPPAARDGQIIVIKAEMKPPMGNRKINIATTDGSTIDGYKEDCITVSHGSKRLIRNNNNWFII
jgi:hypothetical protein